MGLRSVAQDLGMQWEIDIQTDATAAIGICRRRGLGKIRHLAVADLWVQDKVKTGDFTLNKVPGPENPADLLTKYLDGPSIEKHVKRMAIKYEGGRAESAPKLPTSEGVNEVKVNSVQTKPKSSFGTKLDGQNWADIEETDEEEEE